MAADQGEWVEGAGPPPDGLPPSAVRRVRHQRRTGTWNSDLSVPEFAAIRSAGFTPAGQVMGSAVYRIARPGLGACGTVQGLRFPVVELESYGSSLGEARRLALGRLTWEATELGCHGVVGVRLQVRQFPHSLWAIEFSAMGTAVRREGAAPLATPFLSALDGQGLAKLLRAGLVPCGLAIGAAAVHVHTNQNAEEEMDGTDTEVVSFSQAAMAVRSLTMRRLIEDAEAADADGCVGSDLRLDVWRVPCGLRPGRDHLLQFTAVATAVVRFDAAGRLAPGMLVSLRG